MPTSLAVTTLSGTASTRRWAQEAERQAKAITRDLIEVGRVRGFRVEYQKREARFALRAGSTTTYFSAHAYDTPKGMDWLQLRIDILTRVRQGLSRARSRASPSHGAGTGSRAAHFSRRLAMSITKLR